MDRGRASLSIGALRCGTDRRHRNCCLELCHQGEPPHRGKFRFPGNWTAARPERRNARQRRFRKRVSAYRDADRWPKNPIWRPALLYERSAIRGKMALGGWANGPAGGETGTRSGRERGGMDVLLSVGAVFLKKKK